MRFNKLRFLYAAAAMLMALAAAAAGITGTVRDKQGALPEATVRLLQQSDSTFVSGTTTDDKGAFTFFDINPGKYLVEVIYLGYATTDTPVTLGDTDLKMKPIVMADKAHEIGEVSVVGVRTPIKVMEDTIEYNAGTYKTQPNAVVEDVFKRMPGVEVSTDGKITVNGKEVSKILIDGKEFFSDDPTVASRNLPADMVDKVQVVDRKSDLARLTGVDDGEDETVINLTVKKGMKNGWFGNAQAGIGTDNRFMASFMVNQFVNNNQFTFLGNLNNTNQLGFSDGGSRFSRFGGTNGITTSRALGFNFNIGNEEVFRVGGNVLYSNTTRHTVSRSERQYIFPDSVSFNSTGKNSRDRGHNVRGDFRMLWKPNVYNTLEVRPSFSYNNNRSESTDSTIMRAGDAMRSLVNRSLNRNDSRGESYEAGLRVIYNHNFKARKGRSFSLMANYDYSNKTERGYSYSENRFYLLNDSIDLYDQYADNHTWSNTVSARVSWTEPLGDASRGNFLTLSYQMRYRWNDADKLTYDLPLIDIDDPRYTGIPALDYEAARELNDTLSNQFRNNYFNQNIRLGYKHVSKAYTLDVGLSLVPQMSQSHDLINSARNIESRWVWNVAPFLRYKYKMGKTRSLDLNYRGRASQPSMTQLQPVPDYSNPLRVVVGNPDLDPSFTHSARIRFQDFNAEAQRSIMLMADLSLTENSIVSKTEYDRVTGAQRTTYANVNGVWSARLMNMFSMPFRRKSWQFNNNIFLMGSRDVGFNNAMRNAAMNYRVGESFSIAFRPDNWELELRPYYNLQLTRNSLATANNNRTVHTYGGRFDGTYITPFGITVNTDLTFSGTAGYAAGYDTKQWMWNAALSYSFLRAKAATLSLKAYDLLQQKKNISRNVTANYIDDSAYNSLTRYFMVTFAYKFNTFGKGKEPAVDNGMMGPGGMGGGSRGGGRPPRM